MPKEGNNIQPILQGKPRFLAWGRRWGPRRVGVGYEMEAIRGRLQEEARVGEVGCVNQRKLGWTTHVPFLSGRTETFLFWAVARYC
uniref:Predicted protein n=1 Tax=Hordeum vulgare subsp. vulgare TaxID=112509 RepID=F2EKF4_HORVV|nr:predicted protein [Hordeum vulgare subsp. vulgare]